MNEGGSNQNRMARTILCILSCWVSSLMNIMTLTKPSLLVALDFDCKTKVCKFHCGSFALAGQQKVFRLEKGKNWFSCQPADGQDLAKKKASKNNTNRKSWVSMYWDLFQLVHGFYQLLPKLFPDNLSLDLLRHLLISSKCFKFFWLQIHTAFVGNLVKHRKAAITKRSFIYIKYLYLNILHTFRPLRKQVINFWISVPLISISFCWSSKKQIFQPYKNVQTWQFAIDYIDYRL